MIDQNTLNEIIRRIVEVAKPDRIVLFGSAARSETTEESDIDLLVVKKGVPHRRQLAQEIYVRLIGIPVPVDVIVVTPEDVEESKDAIGTIIPAALTEGIEIYAAQSGYCQSVATPRPRKPDSRETVCWSSRDLLRRLLFRFAASR